MILKTYHNISLVHILIQLTVALQLNALQQMCYNRVPE